jgi:16S rRNA processing protein RimM
VGGTAGSTGRIPSKQQRPAQKTNLAGNKSNTGPTTPSNLILVGAILGAFGVRGEIRVKSFTAAPENVFAYGPLLDESGRVVLTPKKWRPLNDALAVTAPEIPTREAAEALKGTRLYVLRDALPATDDGEYYAADLIGCAVAGADGAALGVVKAVTDFGAGDLLEIDQSGRVWRLPFTNENVPTIDLKARIITVDPPAGLLPE